MIAYLMQISLKSFVFSETPDGSLLTTFDNLNILFVLHTVILAVLKLLRHKLSL